MRAPPNVLSPAKEARVDRESKLNRRVALIVAAAENNVIGANGALPWHLPADLKRFKSLTMGKPIVMGRLTHESIGRALPGRRNIVITRDAGYRAAGCEIVTSPADALALTDPSDEVMIIGGGEIYAAFLPLAHKIYLTRVHQTVDGDTCFPALDPVVWRCVASEPLDEQGDKRATFEVLERI